MTDKVTIIKNTSASPRKDYDEYRVRVASLEREFSQTDNVSRQRAINERVTELTAQYGSKITHSAQTLWEEKLAAYEVADKKYTQSERKARRVLSQSAGEHLEVARAEIRAAQNADDVQEVFENARGDNAFLYAVALEAQGKLSELKSQGMESIDRAEIDRVRKDIARGAEHLHYTEALVKEQAAVVEQATALEGMQGEFTTINESFRETSLSFALNRLQIEREVLPDGRLKQTYFVAPPQNFEAAIRRGLEGGKKYAEIE